MLQQQPHKLQKESLTNRYAFSKLIASTMHQKPFFPSLSVQKIHIKMWYNLQYWESCISFLQKNSFPFGMENQRSNQKLHLKYDIFSLIGRNIFFPVNLILRCKKKYTSSNSFSANNTRKQRTRNDKQNKCREKSAVKLKNYLL